MMLLNLSKTYFFIYCLYDIFGNSKISTVNKLHLFCIWHNCQKNFSRFTTAKIYINIYRWNLKLIKGFLKAFNHFLISRQYGNISQTKKMKTLNAFYLFFTSLDNRNRCGSMRFQGSFSLMWTCKRLCRG